MIVLSACIAVSNHSAHTKKKSDSNQLRPTTDRHDQTPYPESRRPESKDRSPLADILSILSNISAYCCVVVVNTHIYVDAIID